ncbi:Oncostatin-M-specific receptor subunit beta [Trichinella spiralis]|uniref:Oncostatin-M-specific receptor subunit beta n=1 Tax=Trichinella spiralis TaxID=6334 RepID=A0ABR3L0K1_TRISP
MKQWKVRFEDRPPAAGEQFYTPCDRFNSDRQTGRSTVLKIWEVFKKIRLSPFDEFLLRDYIFPHRWSKCLQSRSPYFVLVCDWKLVALSFGNVPAGMNRILRFVCPVLEEPEAF